jgi:hypothetical protein
MISYFKFVGKTAPKIETLKRFVRTMLLTLTIFTDGSDDTHTYDKQRSFQSEKTENERERKKERERGLVGFESIHARAVSRSHTIKI